MGNVKKLETEQLHRILEWDREHIENYLVGLYGFTKKEVRAFQQAAKRELKERGELL
jgi:hypothetical protein